MEFPNLTPLFSSLSWAVVGAGATRLYMPERTTNDLDILVSVPDYQQARIQLTQAGATYQGEPRIGETSWRLPNGFPLDVLEGREDWTETALHEAQANVSVEGMPVLPLPYLVLMKFRASRVQDIADITRMLGQATPKQLEEVRQLFVQWLPNDQEDLESLVLLGQLEMQG